MADELAQGGSTTLRNATGTGDYLTRIAGQKSSGGLFREQTDLLRGKGEAEAEVIRGQQRAKETQAAGEVEIAGQMRDKATGLMEEYKATIKPYEEFIPTQNNISDMIGLFGIMSFVGASGGGEGKYAGINALSNMGAAMQGYRMGKKELFEKEMKEFEKNFNATKAFNEQQRELLRQGLETMSYDKELGMAKIRQAAARESGSVVDALIRKGQYEDAFKLADARRKQLADAELKMSLMAQKQTGTGQLPKDRQTLDQYRARFEAVQNVRDIADLLNDPKYSRLITPATKFTPDFLNNLRQNFPELSSKLARIEAIQFDIGGKALTQAERTILAPLYNWRGLTSDALRAKLSEVDNKFDTTNRLVEEDYPGLKNRRAQYEQVYKQFGTLRETPDYGVEGGGEDRFVVGKVYTDGAGKKAQYLGNGNWKDM